MQRRYRADGRDLWQQHPRHGERKICSFTGLGDLAEIDGALFVLDMVHVMGDKDGRLTIYDPDTLEVRQQVWLDTYEGLGFQGSRFLVHEQQGARAVWRGWSLPEWTELGVIAAEDKIVPLKTLLTGLGDLAACDGLVARSLAGREAVSPWAPPITDAERQALLPKAPAEDACALLAQHVRQLLDEKHADARVTRVEVEPAPGAVRVSIWTPKPGLLIGPRAAVFDRLKQELIERLQVEVFVNIVEVRPPAGNG